MTPAPPPSDWWIVFAVLLGVVVATWPSCAKAQTDVARCVAGEMVGFEPDAEARLIVEVIRLRASRRGSSPDAHARAYCQPLRAPRPGGEWVAALPARVGEPWPEGLPVRYKRQWFRLLLAVRGWMRTPATPPACGADHWAAPRWPVDPDHFERVDCGDTDNIFYRWLTPSARRARVSA